MIKCRQGADDADHDSHGVGIAPESAKQVINLFVHHGVLGNGGVEFLFLLFVRKLAVKQQVGDFEKIAIFSQLIDGIATV